MTKSSKNGFDPNADGEAEPILELIMDTLVADVMAGYLRGDYSEGVGIWMFWHFGGLVVRYGPVAPIGDSRVVRLSQPLPSSRAGMRTGFELLVSNLWPDPPAAAAWADDLAKRPLTAAYSVRLPSEGRVEGADPWRPAGIWGSPSEIPALTQEETARALLWLTPFLAAGEIPEVN